MPLHTDDVLTSSQPINYPPCHSAGAEEGKTSLFVRTAGITGTSSKAGEDGLAKAASPCMRRLKRQGVLCLRGGPQDLSHPRNSCHLVTQAGRQEILLHTRGSIEPLGRGMQREQRKALPTLHPMRFISVKDTFLSTPSPGEKLD